jgi:hypothetical protein
MGMDAGAAPAGAPDSDLGAVIDAEALGVTPQQPHIRTDGDPCQIQLPSREQGRI